MEIFSDELPLETSRRSTAYSVTVQFVIANNDSRSYIATEADDRLYLEFLCYANET